MLDKNGHLKLAFWLNTSELVNHCSFRFLPHYNVKIEQLEVSTDLLVDDLQYFYSGGAAFSFSNIPKGNHQIIIIASMNNMQGALNLEVTTTQDGLCIPVQCYLDGSAVMATNSRIAFYSLDNLRFSLVEEPFYYYRNESTYCLNFTAPKNFLLKVDASSREEIDYVLFDILPQNFSVIQTTFLGEPCYQFTFRADSNFNCCLGLKLKGKGWFISPADMRLADIPTSVSQRYLNQWSSQDGRYFDTNDQFVQQWAKQLTENESNPYLIALSIFKNVTKTLDYPSDWKKLEERHAFNESVSQILRDRSGVCRHFARAYAALSIRSGLPARTVIGTAFSFLNETVKKNHEWVEVYLPSCGWVTIDPAWKEFCCLSDKHAKLTYWNYLESTLNVTYIDYTFRMKAKEDSQYFLMYLIQYCRKLSENEPLETEQVETLLDRATALTKNGLIHEALLEIAQAYLLIADNSSRETSTRGELECVFILGLAILLVALFFQFHKLDPTLLKKEEDLPVFAPSEIECRKIEYNTLNELVMTRERSTVIVGSILSSAAFLILTVAFQLDLKAKLTAIMGAILLEGIWLCYYQATGRLDELCYDLLRKLEKKIGIEVHRYLKRCRERFWLVKTRKYIWLVTFMAFWILGLVAFI